MCRAIEVYLITGFLGSGKTACLNHILKHAPAGLKVMVLMNEFGAMGIDGVLTETADLNIVEINKGSIFCACAKTDFIKALAEIAAKFKPNVLLIEATGVANPTDIRRDMQLPFFKGAFNFRKQICLVDVTNFLREFETFEAAGCQIKSADLCLLNKSDLSDADQINAVKNLILQHNPKACFEQTVLGRLNVKRLFPVEPGATSGEPPAQEPLTQQALNAVMRGMLCDLNGNLTPPDTLVSAVYVWAGGNKEDFEALAASLPREIIRIKALLKFNNGDKARFDWVLGGFTFSGLNQNNKLHANYDNLWNHIVLLAKPEVMRAFENATLKATKLTKMAE